ncbi:hypothetical protein [Neptuniibacter sp. QD37_11]|uniref:hypothetical protein n=1 Tax=Neptuniibacter sp. QD37_11 TaxID=3398209 RepID=UPI0039F52DC9
MIKATLLISVKSHSAWMLFSTNMAGNKILETFEASRIVGQGIKPKDVMSDALTFLSKRFNPAEEVEVNSSAAIPDELKAKFPNISFS